MINKPVFSSLRSLILGTIEWNVYHKLKATPSTDEESVLGHKNDYCEKMFEIIKELFMFMSKTVIDMRP